MKTLVIVAHPNIEKSKINKRWIEELKKHPDHYTVHELYTVYPDEKIDVKAEQKLVEAHGTLILQFPVQWFNCPPLLKKWLDEVVLFGWAFDYDGGEFTNRTVALAVTAGIKEEDYSETGRYHITLEQLLAPFQTTFLYTQANYKSFFAFYGAEEEPSAETIDKSAQEYLSFLSKL
ncbi:MAG TPA: NAD(P)H oxidoreductase [Syntrophomonas sp.]|jgi:putative NADPH-quinone reductase|nr:NAD(P)H oxidoreductase [Syntrophomonas sp.]